MPKSDKNCRDIYYCKVVNNPELNKSKYWLPWKWQWVSLYFEWCLVKTSVKTGYRPANNNSKICAVIFFLGPHSKTRQNYQKRRRLLYD